MQLVLDEIPNNAEYASDCKELASKIVYMSVPLRDGRKVIDKKGLATQIDIFEKDNAVDLVPIMLPQKPETADRASQTDENTDDKSKSKDIKDTKTEVDEKVNEPEPHAR